VERTLWAVELTSENVASLLEFVTNWEIDFVTLTKLEVLKTIYDMVPNVKNDVKNYLVWEMPPIHRRSTFIVVEGKRFNELFRFVDEYNLDFQKIEAI